MTDRADRPEDDAGLPPDVQELLRDHVHSYEQLEAAVLLHREPRRRWTGEAVGGALRIATEAAEEALAALAASAIVERCSAEGASAQYAAAPGRMHELLLVFADAYEGNRLAVIRLMNDNALHRVRTNAMRAFADAFLFRKDGKRG